MYLCQSKYRGKTNGPTTSRCNITELKSFVWKSKDAVFKSRIRRCNRCALWKPALDVHLGQMASEVRQRPFKKTLCRLCRLVSAQQDLQRHAVVVPVRETTTKAIIKAFQQRIFASFSVPKIIVTDDVTCFRSWHFKDFYFTLGVLHITTSPYYPTPSHGERFDHNIKAVLIANNADGTGRMGRGSQVATGGV